MSDDLEEDEDDGYFAEIDPDVELTGLEPKFVKIVVQSLNKRIEDVTGAELANMTVAELVPIYIACRNQLATDTKGYKQRKSATKVFMSMISMAIKEKADAVGTDSFKGPYGTTFRRTKDKFSIGDWAAFTAWLTETKNYQVLQKRVSPNAVKEVKESDGSLPPGVTVFSEVEFAVMSPTAKRSK